ncbi:MAG: glutamine amidotransferase [Oscillospiraceae bacterium]|nr:glutamine amidotransferase [Oscillospiraceae bacterium]
MVQTLEYKGYDFFTGARYHESARIMKNLFEGLGHRFTHIPCHLVPENYPRDMQTLRTYDVILFSDVGSNTFLLLPEMVRSGERAVNLLSLTRRYVEEGGGFGMIGGYMTFQGVEAKGKWKDTSIEGILPVTLLPYDDRTEVPEGADLVCDPGSHPIVAGLPEAWPYVLGYNRLILRPEGKVLVRYEDDPILSVREVGKGRTLAYATDCTPHWAPKAMYEWAHYSALWNNIIRWLAGK